MTDYIFVYVGPQNLQLATGKGHFAGAIVTSDSAVPGACTLYDYQGAGPPLITDKIYEVIVTSPQPLVTLFNDRYAPRFHEGVWLILSDNLYATLYVHVPT